MEGSKQDFLEGEDLSSLTSSYSSLNDPNSHSFRSSANDGRKVGDFFWVSTTYNIEKLMLVST
jgi:hypothetical protein